MSVDQRLDRLPPLTSGQYSFAGLFANSHDGGDFATQYGFSGNMELVQSLEQGKLHVIGVTTETLRGRATIEGVLEEPTLQFRKKYIGRHLEQIDYHLDRLSEQHWVGKYTLRGHSQSKIIEGAVTMVIVPSFTTVEIQPITPSLEGR